MLQISNFSTPITHPFGMLNGQCSDANEKEVILMRMLAACIDAGQWISVPVDRRFTAHCLMLARLAYVTAESDGSYRLTNKALELLVKYYPAKDHG
jgi:hypothetical protein